MLHFEDSRDHRVVLVGDNFMSLLEEERNLGGGNIQSLNYLINSSSLFQGEARGNKDKLFFLIITIGVYKQTMLQNCAVLRSVAELHY